MNSERLPRPQVPPGHLDVFQVPQFNLIWTVMHNTPAPGIRADVDRPYPRRPKIEELGNLQLKLLRLEKHIEASPYQSQSIIV